MHNAHGGRLTYLGDDQIRAVREATDLVALFAERTKVSKAGSDHVACCPLHHERTPSLHIYGDGHWYCFGCKEHGDAIDLVRKLDGVEFEDAVQVLARRAGIQLKAAGGKRAQAKADDRSRRVAVMEWAAQFFIDQWASAAAKPARDYLARRGFTDATLATFGIGWAPGYGSMVKAAQAAGHTAQDLVELDLALTKDGRLVDRFFDRFTIPIRDRRGHVVGFTARLLPEAEARAKEQGKGVGKYINTRETPLFVKGEHLFHIAGAQLGRRAGRCFIVEGPLDVMASWQAGERAVVGTLGTALTPRHAQLLQGALGDDADLVLALDGDIAGRRATDSAMQTLLAAGLIPFVGQLPGGKDAGSVLESVPADWPADLPHHLAVSWDACRDSATDALAWLLHANPLDDAATESEILAELDRMLAVAVTLPDQRIVEMSWLQQISDHLAVPLKTVRATWKRFAESAKPASAGEKAPAAPAEVAVNSDYAQMVGRLQSFIQAAGAHPDAMCGWITAEELPADLSDTDVQLEFAHRERMAGQRLIDQELRQATQVIFGRERKERRSHLLARIIGKPSSDAGRAELRKWLTGATGTCRDLDFAVMAHFIWQVKRLATGQVADWPLIPVLYGDQAVGKSTAIERFCDPLAELSFPIDATAITDERKSLVITRALVGRLEEMAGMAKADQEKLKAMATANRAMFRELYSMSLQQRRRTCSFIASSNLSLDAIVTDTTGNRRFYQIDCLSKDWDVMNTVDPLLLWEAASETEDAPIKPFKNQLSLDQKGLVHQDIVSLWLRHETWQALSIRRSDHDQPVLIGPYNPEIGYTLEDLSMRCRFWCAGQSQGMPILPRFIQRLRQERVEKKKITMPGGKTRACRWFVPASFLVGGGDDDRTADSRHLSADLPTASPADQPSAKDFP